MMMGGFQPRFYHQPLLRDGGLDAERQLSLGHAVCIPGSATEE
jgi:hypothetical protein